MKKSAMFAFLTVLLCPLTWSHSSPAYAANPSTKASDILAMVDKLATIAPEQSYTATMEIFKGGELKKTVAFNMKMKELKQQFIEFTAPGDVAGMKILMQDADTLFMYSPEFQKIRRVAAHAQKQGFLGSDMTPEDMVLAELSSKFNATLLGKEGFETKLELIPKEENKFSFAKLELTIDSQVGGVTKIRYMDGGGTAVREQTREEWKPFSLTGKSFKMPTQIRMKNLKLGSETVIKLTDINFETIPEKIFSRSTLLRG